ncbi:hypothetical protein [Hydromonas duriensis]|uniref:Uncharacterized protein n=1 Tax=Hydromonas duriensis TaxID=1527608 RepID=A0A4R6Y6B8_9BURK|nr:hypothetical protein [Hydromonas duriensis]TDR30357.1 hypothetical protein DFR44_12226 [Hydromonas duriensis]
MDQTLINWLALILTGAMSWFLKSLWQSNNRLKNAFHSIELMMAIEYVTQADLARNNNHINKKLIQILETLEAKADKA